MHSINLLHEPLKSLSMVSVDLTMHVDMIQQCTNVYSQNFTQLAELKSSIHNLRRSIRATSRAANNFRIMNLTFVGRCFSRSNRYAMRRQYCLSRI